LIASSIWGSTVSILLDKDVEGTTLIEKASDRRSKSSQSLESRQKKPALHIAILYSPDDVIRLFLNRLELEGDSSDSILCADKEGRCALHLACIRNVSPHIIRMMLKIDREKVSVRKFDEHGLRPIHYACNHIDARRKTIQYLLEAEKMLCTLNVKQDKLDAPNSSNVNSPFWYACRAQAPSDVLELLMSYPGFSLRDFDRVSMRHDLADNIKKNPALQRKINEKMARRFNFLK
jgi:hypothetical protein